MRWCGAESSQHADEDTWICTHFRSAVFVQNVAQMHRRLLGWSDNDPVVNWLYVVACLFLTCMAGLMSGLTLGLLSLDTVDLEVLLRSGTPTEQRYARKIMPIISKSHLLLVTLLTCNAVAMEALPLFLDKLADPVTAVVVSVTAVLFFGEIIPQSVCSRYGLAIGARLAPLVRLLMWLCSPVAWPMGKVLDYLIGPDHHTLFRRRQLKELVSMHAEDAGMGGALTRDEIKVITGALDLTSKIAYRAMTPLDKVFMLSSSDRLDEAALRSILRSGHSRIPVHREGDRGDVVGLVLVKELLQYRLGSSEDVPVSMLRIRSIPRLPATTRMYDMLRLFQTGRSHIAVLTQPARGELERLLALEASTGVRRADMGRSRSVSKARPEGVQGGGASGGGGGGSAAARQASAACNGGGGDGGGRGAPEGAISGEELAAAVRRAAAGAATNDDARSVAAETEGDVDGYMSYNLYYAPSGGLDTSYPPSVLDPSDSVDTAAAVLEAPASFRHWSGVMPEMPRGGEYEESVASSGGGRPAAPPPASTHAAAEPLTLTPPAAAAAAQPAQLPRWTSAFSATPAAASIASEVAAAAVPAAEPGSAPPAGASALVAPIAGAAATGDGSKVPTPAPAPAPAWGHRLTRMGLQANAAMTAAASLAAAAGGSEGTGRGLGSASETPGGSMHSGSAALAALSGAESGGLPGEGGAGTAAPVTAAASGTVTPGGGPPRSSETAGGADPGHATRGEEAAEEEEEEGEREIEEGRPIGIITIEDVIEELIRAEIVDETDRYIDNNRLIRANQAQLAQSLPEHLAKVLAAAGASKKAAARNLGGGSGSQGITPARRSYAAGLALGLGGGGPGGGGGGGSGASTARDLSWGPQGGGAGLRAPLLQGEQ